MLPLEQLVDEIGRFADLDHDISVSESADSIVVKLRQQSEPVQLTFTKKSGRVTEQRDGASTAYSSYRGLLQSAGFGNLRRFVDAHRALIARESPILVGGGDLLPIVGSLDDADSDGSLLDQVDAWLRDPVDGSTLKTLVLDGPAGIGKTHLIRSLTLSRANNFGPAAPAPILHVQSRGRKLTTLNDVIAGTLQALRVTLTFEQVPVLVRHNLLTLAIDGFDELADPYGYETAWRSLRDFVAEIGGGGCLLLAGRDTFIDADKVRHGLPILNTPLTRSAHLRPLKEAEARDWLQKKGWTAPNIQRLNDLGLFEDGGYGLRPFFISQLNILAESGQLDDNLSFPLDALLKSFVEREAKILAGNLKGLEEAAIYELLFSLLKEIGREMADAEADSIDEPTINLLSDLVFQDSVGLDDLGMLRHRAKALALMEPDSVPGRRRFPHSEIQDYFVGSSYIDLIAADEIPKSVRRNILGSDFLDTFHDIVAVYDASLSEIFIYSCLTSLRSASVDDRTGRNLAALSLAALSSVPELLMPPRYEFLALDEVCLRGTLPPTVLREVVISSLDVRGADLRNVKFEKCTIVSLIADSTSVFPAGVSPPAMLFVAEQGRVTPKFQDKTEWMSQHSVAEKADGRPETPHVQLFMKLCRSTMRRFWLRVVGDDHTEKLLAAPEWPAIQSVLESHGYLSVRRDVAVGGPKSDFVRIHDARSFLEPSPTDPTVLKILQEIAAL